VLKKNNLTKLDLDFMYTEGNEGRRQASEYIDAQFDVVFGGKVDLHLLSQTDSVLKQNMRDSVKGPVDNWEMGWSGWGLADESFKPYAKFSVYVSTYTRRYTTYSNDALDAIYKECTKEENRLVDTKVAALTLQGEEEMYKDMTCVPVYAAINNTLYQEYIDLPMESYNAQTGWGWQYSTLK